jgi:MFS transporter, ACS family, hexuronate transporter
MAEADARVGRYRWVICGLLFAATAVNYVDRQMIGLLKPLLSEEMRWSETDYANIVFWFQCAYAIGYLAFGRVVDLVGARMGYAIAVVIWTVAHVAHGAASTVTQFALARFGLGIGEAGNFPGGVKAVANWFPQRERAFAIGIFNAGANVGAIVAPLLIYLMLPAFGWRMTFVLTGVLGVAWLIAWLTVFRDSPRDKPQVSTAEADYIEQDPVDPAVKVSWWSLLGMRETWAYALAKFFIDPIWWFYLFWLPSFLGKQYGLDLTSWKTATAVFALGAIYLISDLGSVIGGWFSSRLLARGATPNRARKLTMFLCALFVLPVMFVTSVPNLWASVLIIGIAAAAHQAFSANVYALPSDLFPRFAVGSVIGIGGTLGAVGGMIFSLHAGSVLERLGTYTPLFVLAGAAYFLALLAVHLLSPRLTRTHAVEAA